MKDSIIGAIALAGLAIGLILLWNDHQLKTNGSTPTAGASFSGTGMLAENYIPYVLYNGGYNSAKDIQTTGNIIGAIGTFSSNLLLTGINSFLSLASSAGTSNIQVVSAAFPSTASTTLCNLQNPSSTATSTVSNIVFNVTTSTSSPFYGVIATSTTSNASTSPLINGWPFVVGQAATSTFVFPTGMATTTQGVTATTTASFYLPVVGPSQWLTIGSFATTGTAGALGITGGAYKIGGNCEATFQTLF